MLSYNHGSKDIVTKVYKILKEEGILPWMDIYNMGDQLNDEYGS